MSPVFSVARNSFREAIRDRILLSLVAFAVLLAGAALLFSQMAFGDTASAVINFSLFAITLFGAVIAVFLGNQLVAKEIERRTLYTLLARPLSRRQFIFGKYFGLLAALALNTALMLAALLVALAGLHSLWQPGESAVLIAGLNIFFALGLLTALSLLFSSFSSPVLAAAFSLVLFLIGNFARDLHGLGETSHHAATRWLALGIYYLLPNFSNFNLATSASHFQPPPGQLLAWNAGYAAFYMLILLGLASLILETRDLK